MHDYNSNIILGEPMKSRTDEEIMQAFRKMHGKLKECGITPKLHRLDNEGPDILKSYMKKKKSRTNLYRRIFTGKIRQKGPFHL